MKKVIITVLLILSQISYSQHPFSGVVEYTIEPSASFDNSKLTNDKDYAPGKKKELTEIFSKPAYFVMEFTSNESLYKSKESIMESDSDKRPKLNFLKTFGGTGVFYSNSKEKRTLNERDAFGELLLISYQFPIWELINESKKIGEFNCYKAIKKSNSKTAEIVWYSPEIPVQFGPGLYNGLPGLVLEVQVGKVRIIASKVKLNIDLNIIIEKPVKGSKISEEEYHKKVMEMADEFGF